MWSRVEGDGFSSTVLRDEVPLPVSGLEHGERERVDDRVVDGVGQVHRAMVEDLADGDSCVHDPCPGLEPARGGGGAVEGVFGDALRGEEEYEKGD